MKWSEEEMKIFWSQVNEGVYLSDIKIPNRTEDAIKYKFYSLGLKVASAWSEREILSIKDQLAEGKHIKEVIIPGRSLLAIRNKAIRNNLWRKKPRSLRSWNMLEVRALKRLVVDRGYTARQVYTNEYLEGRSTDSIAQQMRRLGIKRIGSKYA